MKVKQILLIITALLISCFFLYPMYTNSEKEKYCESLKNKINKLEKESSNKDVEILKLKNSLLESESELSSMNEEVKRLSDENSIFTSMFAEIEGRPGGHKILKYLWDEMGNSK